MEQVINIVAEPLAEILTVVLGTLLVFIFRKMKSYLDKAGIRDEMGIIDIITDRAAEYAEAELRGKKGQEKLDFAVIKASQILSARGIKVSDEELRAGIENGVNKLRQFKTQ